MIRKKSILLVVINLAWIGMASSDDGIGSFFLNTAKKVVEGVQDLGGKVVEEVQDLGDGLRDKWRDEPVEHEQPNIGVLMDGPITECHGRQSRHSDTDPDAPIIAAPEAWHINVNNSVWVTARGSGRVQLQFFFKQHGQLIHDLSNCYTLVLRGANEQDSHSVSGTVTDVFLPAEFLPPGYIPGTSTGVDFVVRWRHDDGPWYQDRKQLKTTVLDRVFIQTDKPVYRPEQTVTIRIYLVDINLKPVSGNINVYIISPDDVVYQKDSVTTSESTNQIQGMYQLTFDFPVASTIGLWKITVEYGPSYTMDESAAFELQEYTLPTFSVQVEIPDVIQNSKDAQIPIYVAVRHVFGENEAVHGSIECYAAISKNGKYPPSFYKWPRDEEPLCIGTNGTVNLTLDMNNYNTMNMLGMDGQQLLVYCNATEYFTDDQASGQAVAVFAQHMYSVDFRRSPAYFKSGLPYVFQADVTLRQSKTPAPNAVFLLEMLDVITQERLANYSAKTDENGQIFATLLDLPNLALFIQVSPVGVDGASYVHQILPQEGHAIKIIPRIVANQAIDEVTIVASDFNAVKALYFLAVSNGNILSQKVKIFRVGPVIKELFPRAGYRWRYLSLSGHMAPYVDLVVFYFDLNDRPIVDTLRIAVQHECNNVQERISTDQTTYEPREEMQMRFHGFHNTGVAPLMVDNAARLLGSHGTITQTTITDSITTQDHSCAIMTSRQSMGQLGFNIFGLNITEECARSRHRRSTSLRCATVSGRGPHSMNCLKQWWVQTGCSLDGSLTPGDRPDVNYWHGRTVSVVKAYMRTVKQQADAGVDGYAEKCHGSDKTSIPNVGQDCCAWAREEEYNIETWTCGDMFGALLEYDNITQHCISEAYRCCQEVTVNLDVAVDNGYAYGDPLDYSYMDMLEASIAEEPTFEYQIRERGPDNWEDAETHTGFSSGWLTGAVSKLSTTITRKGAQGAARSPQPSLDWSRSKQVVQQPSYAIVMPAPGLAADFFEVEEPVILPVKERPLQASPLDPRSNQDGRQVNELPPEEMIRKSFPESIILPVGTIGNTHTYDLEQAMPDSITSWNIQAIYLSPTSGMCIPQARDVDVLKDIFLRVSMPYKVVRGEHVKMAVVIHNRSNKATTVNLTLEHVDEGLCHTPTVLSQIDVHETSRHYQEWIFVAKEAGTHSIIISVRKYSNSSIVFDKIQQTVVVSYEGIRKVEKRESVLLGHRPPGFTHKVNVTQFADHWTVDNSTKTFVKLSGNVMGPSVDFLLNQMRTTRQKNLGYVIRRLSSTLYAAMYLKKTNNLDQDHVQKIKKKLRKGVQDLRSFKKTDGSFSKSKQGASSPWLTAASLKVMNKIEHEFPKYTEISDEIICDASQWLMNKQRDDGSFKELTVDTLGKQATNRLALTSLVLRALHNVKCSVQAVQERSEEAAWNAKHFIRNAFVDDDDSYTWSHIAVAMARHGDSSASNYYEQLSVLVYEITDQTLEEVTSRQVETVSHALITSVVLDHPADYNHFAQWLLKTRNEDGEFILSKDTASGLEALYHYASKQATIRMPSTCAIASSTSEEPEYNVTIDPLRTDHLDITHLGDEVELSCAGESAIHAEVFHEYHTLEDSPACFLKIQSTVERFRGRGKRSAYTCGSDNRAETGTGGGGRPTNRYTVTVCLESNHTMVVDAEVHLLSGHTASQPSIDDAEHDLDHIHEIEHNHDRSALRIEMSLETHERHCVSFRTLTKSASVGHIQPALISVQNEETGLVCNALYYPSDDDPLTVDSPCDN